MVVQSWVLVKWKVQWQWMWPHELFFTWKPAQSEKIQNVNTDGFAWSDTADYSYEDFHFHQRLPVIILGKITTEIWNRLYLLIMHATVVNQLCELYIWRCCYTGYLEYLHSEEEYLHSEDAENCFNFRIFRVVLTWQR